MARAPADVYEAPRVALQVEVEGFTDHLLRWPQVHRVTGISHSHAYDLISRGQFPRPIAVSPMVRLWRASEIRDWMNALQHPKEQTGRKRRFAKAPVVAA